MISVKTKTSKTTRANKTNTTAAAPSANVVSRQDQIAKKAFELFEKRGGQHGDALQDWFEAERWVDAQRGY